MRKGLLLISLFIFIAGCGDDLAPDGAVLTGPADATFTVLGSTTGSQVFTLSPLEFSVKTKDGQVVSNVEIEFFSGAAGGSTRMIDQNDNVLNSIDPTFFETKTDDRGLARIFLEVTIPPCLSTTAFTVTSFVDVSVGSASKLMTATFTVTCPTTE